jgi:hypothetical protein
MSAEQEHPRSRGFRDRYGQTPLHLIAAIATFAIAAYAFLEIFDRPSPVGFVVWFGAAIIAHDLITFPLYSLLNAIAGRAAGRAGPRGWLNYVRIPAFLAALAFLVWFPFILGFGSSSYEGASGRSDVPFLERWLLLTAGLFAVSGVAYAVRARLGRRPEPSEG